MSSMMFALLFVTAGLFHLTPFAMMGLFLYSFLKA